MLTELYLHTGPGPLSDADLLAIALGARGGRGPRTLAADLLDRHGSVGALLRAAPRELATLPGLGTTTATRLHATLALGRRARLDPTPLDAPVTRPDDGAERLRALFDAVDHEQVGAMYLNARNRVLGLRIVSQGGTDSAIVDARVILGIGLRLGATALVLAHNHPSGDPEPSPTDIATTRALAAAARTVGLRLLDHFVFGGERWTSLAMRGEIP